MTIGEASFPGRSSSKTDHHTCHLIHSPDYKNAPRTHPPVPRRRKTTGNRGGVGGEKSLPRKRKIILFRERARSCDSSSVRAVTTVAPPPPAQICGAPKPDLAGGRGGRGADPGCLRPCGVAARPCACAASPATTRSPALPPAPIVSSLGLGVLNPSPRPNALPPRLHPLICLSLYIRPSFLPSF